MQFLPSFWSDTRLRVIVILSLGVTILGCMAIIALAGARDLDPIAITGDAKGYIVLAENLLEHGVFSIEQSGTLYPESFRAPGYPAFLAVLFALFGTSVVTLVVQSVIMAAAPIFLYILVRSVHERAAFWGSVVFIFDPIRVFLASSFLSDALFAVLLLASLVVVVSVKDGNVLARAFFAGVLVGVCILVRPIAMFLPLLFAAYLVIDLRPSTRAVGAGFLLCLGALGVIFPWMYRNHVHFGSWNIASVGVANLMLYNAPEFLEWRPSESGNVALAEFRAEQESLPREDALSLARSGVFEDTFLSIIRGREIEYMAFHVLKTIPFFLTDGLRDTIRLFKVDIGEMPNISTAMLSGDVARVLAYIGAGNLAIVLLVVGSAFWGSASLLFACEGVRALIATQWRIVFLALVVAYFAVLTGPVSNARYREAVAGLIIALAALTLSRWYDARHARK